MYGDALCRPRRGCHPTSPPRALRRRTWTALPPQAHSAPPRSTTFPGRPVACRAMIFCSGACSKVAQAGGPARADARKSQDVTGESRRRGSRTAKACSSGEGRSGPRTRPEDIDGATTNAQLSIGRGGPGDGAVVAGTVSGCGAGVMKPCGWSRGRGGCAVEAGACPCSRSATGWGRLRSRSSAVGPRARGRASTAPASRWRVARRRLRSATNGFVVVVNRKRGAELLDGLVVAAGWVYLLGAAGLCLRKEEGGGSPSLRRPLKP
ncbi:uncharacterized protein A4U43_C03F22390 [Asparagus officinalis]|uniref:Uncharacterized protein n=1 Tax=Asparagus officinalis TaxID=4686 RepID=A0A5P1FCX7_ASPOF|nr:uncharacterized protein A4U43_C03F22390 [Asparagus officinalis]